jgi:4-amino-4-deoxy-L-arabinose transferase-like glycosyltransferase
MAGACFGIAFLIKGFMAIPAAIALIPYLIKQRHLLNPWLYLGLMVGAIPPAAWLWAASAKHGSIVLQMMVGKMFILGSETWMDAGPTYYFWNVPANGFPWVFLALGGGVLLLRQARSAIANWLLIGYPVVLFVELTLFRTRTHYYPLQLMPFVGLLAAIALHHLMEKYRDRQGLLTILHGVLGSLGLLLLGASIWILGFSPFDPAIKPIAGVVLILSLGWLWICAIWYFRQSAQGWGAAWLVTSWLALAMLNATSWGNYAPQLKTFLEQPQVAQVLRSHPIKFVLDSKTQRPSDFETYVLLSFYTLQPSIEASLTQLSPQDFAWVDPIQQSAIPPNMTRISTFRNWTLVQR